MYGKICIKMQKNPLSEISEKGFITLCDAEKSFEEVDDLSDDVEEPLPE